MRNRLLRSQRLRRAGLFGLFLLALLAAVSTGTGVPSTQIHTAQEKPLQVHNKTASVEIVSAAKDKDRIHVSFRNNSSKFITGLLVRLSGRVTVQTEFLGTSEVFAPGSIHDESYGVEQETGQQAFTLLCVMFEDDTAEGEPKYIKRINDRRYGQRVQSQRAMLLIDQLLSSPEADTPAGLEKLKAQISSLPEEPEDGRNDDILGGLKDAKGTLLYRVEAVERKRQTHPAVNLAEELTAIKQHYARGLKN